MCLERLKLRVLDAVWDMDDTTDKPWAIVRRWYAWVVLQQRAAELGGTDRTWNVPDALERRQWPIPAPAGWEVAETSVEGN